MNKNTENWYKLNMAGLTGYFDPNQISLYTGPVTAIIVEGFELPQNFQQTHTNLMLMLPDGDSIFWVTPDRFYLNQGLRLIDGSIPEHYFEDGGFNDLSDEGWARYSFHLHEWRPNQDVVSGTTIYDILEAIYTGLSKL